MNLLTGLFVASLLFPTNVFAGVNFQFPDTDEGKSCQEQTRAWIEEVNKKLPKDWIPDNFYIIYSGPGEYGQAKYLPVLHYLQTIEVTQKVIAFEGLCQKALFVQSYSHLVLDNLMRKQSLYWEYFIVWYEVRFEDIDETVTEDNEALVSLKRMHQERIQGRESAKTDEEKITHIDIANRLVHSISFYEGRIGRLARAQEIQAQSEAPLDAFNHHGALRSYSKLFADTIIALVSGDWSAVKKATLSNWDHMKANGLKLEEALIFPKTGGTEDPMSALLRHSDFVSDLFVENYAYAPWEANNTNFHFAPMRSWIRDRMEGDETMTATSMIQALGLAIIDVYEKELIPNPENLERPLLEKNRSLREALTKHFYPHGFSWLEQLELELRTSSTFYREDAHLSILVLDPEYPENSSRPFLNFPELTAMPELPPENSSRPFLNFPVTGDHIPDGGGAEDGTD